MQNVVQSDREVNCKSLNIFKFIRAACVIATLGKMPNTSEPESANS